MNKHWSHGYDKIHFVQDEKTKRHNFKASRWHRTTWLDRAYTYLSSAVGVLVKDMRKK